MIRVTKRVDTERCPECGKVAPRIFLVQLAVLEFTLCIDCLQELKYAMFEHTRWP